MRKTHLTAALALLSTLGLASAQKPRVVIATGGIGGVYYYYGTVMAEILSKYAGVDATAIQTAASVDNILLITEKTDPSRNTYYCGLVLPESGLLAYTGQIDRFKDKPATKLRTLFATYPNYLQIVTTKGTGTVLQNLIGKRISLGAPGSGTEIEANLVLEAAKIPLSKFSKVERLGANESGQALADGTIDAYFWSGGLPTGSIAELGQTLSRKGKQLDFIAVPQKGVIAGAFEKAFPGLADVSMLNKKVYNSARSVETLAFWNAFSCSSEMPAELAYNITKATFEHLPDLTAAVQSAKDTTPANALRLSKSKVPYHEGALKYLKK
ncbi:TRAP transporter substrate-binding protein [Deinococcus irradiatisoli]|uniref:TRAP transporter substrate-binding protein n=1 Tax=Deinococcus irradiatisoli TaxID=2202254 RepID=A0A2Z3JCB8_9DEIO|nr:TAXI family TRAP transporter solute-binding subunit [Deinococcus irradiatisoli]AWN22682.1 TRAP transporter substrate-binding protein [Deinococcus irradiatisoli]